MKVYIDSNIFIYFILKDLERAKKCGALLKKISNKEIDAVASVLALCEVHYNVAKYIGKKEAFLAVKALLSLPINYTDIDVSVLASALIKSRETNLKTFDAIHLATALMNSADVIYSYDTDFDNKIRRLEPN